MPEVKHEGQVYILPKKEDTILKVEKGRILVECTALKGKTNYWRYDNFDVMIEKETKPLIMSKSNEKRRTDAVNGINRPVSVESKVRKNYKDTRESVNQNDKAEFDASVAAYIKSKAASLNAKREKEIKDAQTAKVQG